MDKRQRCKVVDIERVPPWPLRISPPRLSRRAGMGMVTVVATTARAKPIELRALGSNGFPMGTEEDCFEGSGWELRGEELVRRESHQQGGTSQNSISK